MPTVTYTILLTITNDVLPSTAEIAAAIQEKFEDPMCMESAQADAFEGDKLNAIAIVGPEGIRATQASDFHADLRENT